MANRLSTIHREQLPADQRRFHDAVKAIRRRPISGPFIVLLNASPDLAARFAHLGHYFHARGQEDESILPLRVRGFIALIGSRALDGTYEWSAWLNWTLDAGVPQTTVDAIREGKVPPDLTSEEALVMEICTQLLTGAQRLSDRTFSAALEHFGAQGLVELVVTLGYFAMIAIPLNAFEIEMTSEQMGMRKPFKPLPVAERPAEPAGGEFVPAAAGDWQRSPAPRAAKIRKHEDLPAGHQHFFDRIIRTRGRVSGPFEVLLHSPDIAERVAAIGELVLYETHLPPLEKALAWLITAGEFRCDYEWAAAVSAAGRTGVTGATIEAIRRRQPLSDLTGAPKRLADFCYQLLRGHHRADDSTYGAVAGHYGVPATVQLAATVGYFAMQALLLNAFGVTPEGEPSELVL